MVSKNKTLVKISEVTVMSNAPFLKTSVQCYVQCSNTKIYVYMFHTDG